MIFLKLTLKIIFQQVKIDGNRRILAYLVNSKDVAVRIEDMSGKYD